MGITAKECIQARLFDRAISLGDDPVKGGAWFRVRDRAYRVIREKDESLRVIEARRTMGFEPTKGADYLWIHNKKFVIQHCETCGIEIKTTLNNAQPGKHRFCSDCFREHDLERRRNIYRAKARRLKDEGKLREKPGRPRHVANNNSGSAPERLCPERS